MTQEKHKSQRSETKSIGECRIAFPFHYEKRTKSAGGVPLEKPRYDCVVLLPKLNADPAQCANYAMLAAMCMDAANKAWGSFPQGGKWPIQDGDVPHTPKPKPGVTPLPAEQIAAKGAWRKGHWVFEASALDPGPRVGVMQNGVPTEIPAKVINGVQMYKSGDYGFVSLNAYTFHNQTFGVNLGYEGVLYTRPGEAIGASGPRSLDAMFGGVPAAPKAPSAPPMPPAPPLAPAPPTPPLPSMLTAPSLPPFPPR